jgi:hypothetical protein
MKKLILVLVLATVVTGGLFAQTFESLFNLGSGPTRQKNAIFVDISPLLTGLFAGGFGLGLGYERDILPNVSVLVHGDFLTFKVLAVTFGAFDIDFHGRWYPFNTAIDKLFIDVGIGYGSTSYDSTAWKGSQSILSIGAKAGWKFILSSGFVVEPQLGWTFASFVAEDMPSGYVPVSVGGFGWGIGLGWAF